MSDCEQLREHYEAYAIGALEGEERAQLEAHLARSCPVCTPEVEYARWVVSQLAYLAPEAEPPKGLRRRVLERARGVEMPRRSVPAWEWVAAAALLLITVYSIYTTRRAGQQIAALREQIRAAESQNAQLQQERNTLQQAMAILAAPGTKETLLEPSGAEPRPALRAYWNAELGVVLSGQQIPQPAPGRAFQLWVVPKKGNPISAGIFRPDATGRVLLVASPEAKASEAAALAISDEPAQGSPQPTTRPTWVGPFS